LFAGRPLVASAVQGLAEIVVDGENGLLVPPDDPAALATAIGRLLDDPDLARRLADRGREDAADRFSRATYQQRIAASVAELRRPGRSSKR